MALCPFAVQKPLASKITQPRMSRYDLFIPHTMGGNSLEGCDRDFRASGYTGLEAHFGIGDQGEIWQWVDTAYTADAQLDGNPRTISVETADAGTGFPKWSGSNVPAWNDAQLASIIRLGIWVCDTHGIPKVMAPDSKPTSRGIAGHRQGVDSSPPGLPGYRVPGGEHWSTSVGKICPGDRRFAQLKAIVVPGIQSGDEVTQADIDAIAHAVWAYDQAGAKSQAWAYLQDAADEVTAAAIAAAVVAVLPPAATGGITKDDVKAAVVDVLTNGTNGGTS